MVATDLNESIAAFTASSLSRVSTVSLQSKLNMAFMMAATWSACPFHLLRMPVTKSSCQIASEVTLEYIKYLLVRSTFCGKMAILSNGHSPLPDCHRLANRLTMENESYKDISLTFNQGSQIR